MKTDELINMLANQAPPVDRQIVAGRFGKALVIGLVLALLLLLALPASLLAGALLVTTRLARPGAPVGNGWATVALPVIAVWLAALGLLLSVSANSRWALIFGETWRVCPLNIALLSIPTFACVFWAIRGFAPTRLRLAGAAGGLLAGSMATLAYSLHCPEMSVAFWAVWYVLGMLIPTAVGALFGPRLLRW